MMHQPINAIKPMVAFKRYNAQDSFRVDGGYAGDNMSAMQVHASPRWQCALVSKSISWGCITFFILNIQAHHRTGPSHQPGLSKIDTARSFDTDACTSQREKAIA